MTVQELMIDDVVRDIKNGTTIRVAKINKIAIRDADEEIFFFDGIEPIPLTPEILEKNGCTMTDKGDYGEWHIKENPNIPLWQHTEFIIFGGVQINFVHELQHALRLCGLDELANNFKIE